VLLRKIFNVLFVIHVLNFFIDVQAKNVDFQVLIFPLFSPYMKSSATQPTVVSATIYSFNHDQNSSSTDPIPYNCYNFMFGSFSSFF